MPDEAALLEAWRLGDSVAGSRLLERCFPALFRFFYNKVGIDTEDLVQQTMMDCVAHRDRFRGDSSFTTFVLRIARNRLYDFLRQRVSRGDRADLGVSSVIDLGTRLSGVAADRQGHQRVVEALRRLPVDLQVVLELHYWQELAVTEVADVLELPLGTVKTRLRRAKELLREALDRPDGEGEEIEASLRVARELVLPSDG